MYMMHVVITCTVLLQSQSVAVPSFKANTKLSEMNSELSKAQEHAHRFQDLLMTERRKQKALQVHVHVCTGTCSLSFSW